MTDKVRKTAQERAQEAVGVAQRKVDSITKRLAAAKAQVETLESDLKAEKALLDFAKSHPALTQETAPAAPVAEEPLPEAGEKPASTLDF